MIHREHRSSNVSYRPGISFLQWQTNEEYKKSIASAPNTGTWGIIPIVVVILAIMVFIYWLEIK